MSCSGGGGQGYHVLIEVGCYDNVLLAPAPRTIDFSMFPLRYAMKYCYGLIIIFANRDVYTRKAGDLRQYDLKQKLICRQISLKS